MASATVYSGTRLRAATGVTYGQAAQNSTNEVVLLQFVGIVPQLFSYFVPLPVVGLLPPISGESPVYEAEHVGNSYSCGESLELLTLDPLGHFCLR